MPLRPLKKRSSTCPAYLQTLALAHFQAGEHKANLAAVYAKTVRYEEAIGRQGLSGSSTETLGVDFDGDPDLYFVNGAPLPGYVSQEIPTNCLYRNNGDGTFTDVTEKAGVGDTGYGHGCAVGDYNNDGQLDLYVTNYGTNRLYLMAYQVCGSRPVYEEAIACLSRETRLNPFRNRRLPCRPAKV